MNIKPGEYKLVIRDGWYQSIYDKDNNLIYYKENDFEQWREFDSNNNQIHYKDSDGYEVWYEYDTNNNIIHHKNSNGHEKWYNDKGRVISKEEFNRLHSTCHGKIVEVDGKRYKLIEE